MRLPQSDQAFIDIGKLRDYCLDQEHPRGKHKAKVFQTALGIYREDSQILENLILAAVVSVDCELGISDQYGVRYSTDLDLTHQAWSARVRVAWIIKAAEDFPRLTTCYIL